MNIKYFSKNYNASDNFKELLEKKVFKFERYFKEQLNVKVNLDEVKDMCKLEITFSTPTGFYRAEVVSDNMYNNIDTALRKIERQVVKQSKKHAERFKRDALQTNEFMFLQEEPEIEVSKIVRRKHFELLPSTPEEAIEQMDALGHSFYVFLDDKTNNVSVVYKRTDTDYGVIEVSY